MHTPCERREYVFIVLPEYSIIFRKEEIDLTFRYDHEIFSMMKFSRC